MEQGEETQWGSVSNGWAVNSIAREGAGPQVQVPNREAKQRAPGAGDWSAGFQAGWWDPLEGNSGSDQFQEGMAVI